MNYPEWSCGRFQFGLERPLVMGIVNVTPDSFYDGNAHNDLPRALDHARQLIAEGADILDIGGESTRPGAEPVSLEQELERVIPLIEGLRDSGVALSVDTFKPDVMRASLAAGADMINDIYALRMPGAIEAVKDSDCGLCIMHMQGEPKTMQEQVHYDNVVVDVRHFLQQRCEAIVSAGIQSERIMLDPGFGFGKTAAHNYQLLRDLQQAAVPGYPWLIGLSRKSMIGHVTGKPASERLIGSLSAALACVARGAKIVRVHDVAATREALDVWNAVECGVSE
ncbi:MULTISPECIES: dihydropteroate synthase [Alcaligenes]|jgi:dihydropteroate synthase|uniref:dihydropteroate synthase n=2 Tax=Alcaligenes TaxID=507 RepID=A0ABY4NIJ6_9BURK|nr:MULTISPECIES: dihydropteroate synthase [Alcaligenes]MCC9163924.1 dihydropteroate synthase [Alcaligenes sp. MMA]MCH4226048.1 dihydropteroate synthase [Alcaligenes faecalis]QXR36820.1 dihydropteroate synthase [Alcaligenes aquatilis]UQN36828.1 dihydropteroate synthase [Alcaligenes aquatilis]UYY88156.1 dihydropteroate synthase [Alcaligenes sp. SMD-FA]